MRQALRQTAMYCVDTCNDPRSIETTRHHGSYTTRLALWQVQTASGQIASGEDISLLCSVKFSDQHLSLVLHFDPGGGEEF